MNPFKRKLSLPLRNADAQRARYLDSLPRRNPRSPQRAELVKRGVIYRPTVTVIAQRSLLELRDEYLRTGTDKAYDLYSDKLRHMVDSGMTVEQALGVEAGAGAGAQA